MAPWDEQQLFDTPVTSLINVPPGSQILVGADPNRVVLIIQGIEINFVGVFPSPNDPALPGVVGLMTNQSMQPIILLQKDHGPLAQVTWGVTNNNAVGVNVSVIEVRLRVWTEAPVPVGVMAPQRPVRISEEVISNARSAMDRLRRRLGSGILSRS